MAKRKTAPTDSNSSTKKTKPTKAAPNTKFTKTSASRPSISKATAKLEAAQVLDSVVVNDTPAGLTESIGSITTSSTSATSINDEDEFEIDFDAVEDNDNSSTLIDSDDDNIEKVEASSTIEKIEEAIEVVLDEKTPDEAVATPKADTAADAIAITASVEKTPEEVITANAEVGNKSEQENQEAPTVSKAKYARQALINGLTTQLTYSPAMLSMAGASVIGDTVDVTLNVNGLKIDVSFKVVGLEELAETDEQVASEDNSTNTTAEVESVPAVIDTTEKPRGLSIDIEKAQNALQKAAPLSANTFPTDTRAHIPCKFGESCSKGNHCHFDHTSTIKKKLCTWVNTTKGCAKGNDCHFSYEHEGKLCSKSTSRMTCENGATCAFKHKEDGAKSSRNMLDAPLYHLRAGTPGSLASSHSPSIASVLSPGLLHNALNQYQGQSDIVGYKDSYNSTSNVPTRPKYLGKGAGQKRHAESEENGYDALRPCKYSNNNPIQHHNQQQTGYAPTGPQNSRSGRRFSHPRGGHGHRGKHIGRGGRQHNP
ncbi:hypothetical protein T440DRAFT_541323 [Plenodomus tracheiphilus IPT5]|uniref:C3H1-type domain-containing protein n=1 Tax=Plenodomus tracheiphilus IPT5 TaxID=1408161 RepID=A0A6A7AW77_9PLEO|nr:hypothetical protein T440DRAFT_541323 [Plenodomus tracheiphilus IPT5]